MPDTLNKMMNKQPYMHDACILPKEAFKQIITSFVRVLRTLAHHHFYAVSTLGILLVFGMILGLICFGAECFLHV